MNDIKYILEHQMKLQGFDGFPLLIFGIFKGLFSEYFVDNCLDKVKSPVTELLEALINHITEHASYDYKYSDGRKQLEKLVDFMLKRIDLLDCKKDMNILYLVCANMILFDKIFDKMIDNGFIPDEKCLEIVLKKWSRFR